MTVHVIGAGLAGLVAAWSAGRGGPASPRVVLHEASPGFGGRARALGDGVDNGTHALLSGNRAALGFLRAVGAEGGWVEPEPAGLPVLDLADGSARRVSLSPLGWWRASARPAGLSLGGLAAVLRLAGPGRDRAVAEAVSGHPVLARGYAEPLAVAALNTPLAEASTRRLGAVLRRAARPGAARLLVARRGLGPDLVEPALAALRAGGVEIRTGSRLRAVESSGGRASVLDFGEEQVALGPGDSTVLALPPWEASRLLPELSVPESHAPILNLHFAREGPGPVRFLGLLGGLCQWVLVRPSGVAVTVSAADAETREPAEALAPRAWAEIRRAATAFGLAGDWPEAAPPCRAVKERRATPRHRPGGPPPPPPRPLANLALAGDWTDPVLPATLEAAARSGRRAARLLGLG